MIINDSVKIIINFFVFIRHPTTCSSMADILSVLFFHTMKYDPKQPRHPANDRFVLSKVI